MQSTTPHTLQAPPVFNFSREIARKLVHATGLLVPLIYFFTPRPLAMAILAALSGIGIALDFARHRHQPTTRTFQRCFGLLLRSHEQDPVLKHLNAVTWFFIAATIGVAIFPKYVAIVSITVALVGDAASCLIGRRFGRPRFHGKSLEGSLAFFISAFLVLALFEELRTGHVDYLICATAALVGAIAEVSLAEFVDDNFIVPLTIGACLWLMQRLLLPGFSLDFGV